MEEYRRPETEERYLALYMVGATHLLAEHRHFSLGDRECLYIDNRSVNTELWWVNPLGVRLVMRSAPKDGGSEEEDEASDSSEVLTEFSDSRYGYLSSLASESSDHDGDTDSISVVSGDVASSPRLSGSIGLVDNADKVVENTGSTKAVEDKGTPSIVVRKGSQSVSTKTPISTKHTPFNSVSISNTTPVTRSPPSIARDSETRLSKFENVQGNLKMPDNARRFSKSTKEAPVNQVPLPPAPGVLSLDRCIGRNDNGGIQTLLLDTALAAPTDFHTNKNNAHSTPGGPNGTNFNSPSNDGIVAFGVRPDRPPGPNPALHGIDSEFVGIT